MQEAAEYVMFFFYHFVTKTNRYMNRYKQKHSSPEALQRLQIQTAAWLFTALAWSSAAF